MVEMDEQVLEDLYAWIDQIPLSRPKKDLRRDFSDGVLVAEVVKHFYPQYVELHNYAPALAVSKKAINWHLLNRKVFKRLGFEVSDDVIDNVTACKPWAAEQFLLLLQQRFSPQSAANSHQRALGGASGDRTTVDQIQTAAVAHPSEPSKQHQLVDANGSLSPGSQTKESSRLPTSAPPTGLIGSDLVPKQLLDEKVQELLAKEETIQILQAKITRLEHLIQLKDIRIEDLQTRLQQVETKPTAKQQPPGKMTRPVRK